MHNKKEIEEIKEELWCTALRDGHTMQYRALGWSMWPFIRNGSILTVKPKERIAVGDVILYKSRGSLIAHRVIGKRKVNGRSVFVTKGDNLSGKDIPVDASELLGKVVIVESEKKRIQMDCLLRKFLNYAIAVASPLFLSRMLFLLKKIRAMTSLKRVA